MICKVCGRQIANESANFCEYCGISLRENKNSFEPDIQNIETVSYNKQEWGKNEDRNENLNTSNLGKFKLFGTNTGEKEAPISFLQWLIMMVVVPIIPVVGPLIYLVMLFLIAFGKTQQKTLKNWARVMLIMFVIAFLMIFSMAGEIMNVLNGMV